MRFGIMAMQMGMLVPPGQPAEQILANITHFDHADLVSRLAAQGFNPVELGGDLSLFLPHTFSAAAIDDLLDLKDKGIWYRVRLPGYDSVRLALSAARRLVRTGLIASFWVVDEKTQA